MVITRSNVVYAQYAFKKHNNTTDIVKISTGIIIDTAKMVPIPSSLIEYVFSLECDAVLLFLNNSVYGMTSFDDSVTD